MSRYYCGPRLRARNGKGWRECQRTGFIEYAEDAIDDVRGGMVRPESADLTPGFGTHHPSDLISLGTLDDPSRVSNARPETNPNGISKQDLGLTDQQVAELVRQGKPIPWR